MPASHLLVAVHHPVVFARVPLALVAVLSSLLEFSDTTPAARRCISLPLVVGVFPPHITELADTLGEVDVDAAVVDENALHLEVCRLT